MRSKKRRSLADVAAEGGRARAERLSAEERSEIARLAAESRWRAEGKAPTLRATHDGTLMIGAVEIPCAVLEDGTRVVTQAGVFRSIGRTGKSTGRAVEGVFRLPVFLQSKALIPYISKELIEASESIKFKPSNGGAFAYGYRAEIIPLTCRVFLEAERDGVLNNKQAHIAEQCRILGRGFELVGITALIDEATGYQEIRDRKALQQILDHYLRREWAAWAKRFPDEFYRQIFRLRNWEWKGMKVNRPGVVAKYTNDLVYARLAPGVLDELERLNPIERGRRAVKHHQFLTDDVGHPALQAHLTGVMAIMRGSTTWEQAQRLVQRAFPKINTTFDLPFPEDA